MPSSGRGTAMRLKFEASGRAAHGCRYTYFVPYISHLLLLCTPNVHTIKLMKIEWDVNKATQNLRKHGIDFADAVIALEDENALTVEDRGHDEQRFKTLGLGPELKILLVVYVFRTGDIIRIISARKADRSETKQYYQGISI
jgi:uncharacterized DUF497 family protein